MSLTGPEAVGEGRAILFSKGATADSSEDTRADDTPASPTGRCRLRPTPWVLGIACIVIVALIWSGSSYLVQFVYREQHFSRPFTLTYTCTSWFIVYLPLWYGWRLMLALREPARPHEEMQQLLPSVNWAASAAAAKPATGQPREALRLGIMLCPLWFAANYLYNLGLELTSVSSSTVISSSSTVFTLGLSAWLVGEPITPAKLAGVALTVAGVCCVGFSDDAGAHHGRDAIIGDACSLLSAFCYACYTVTLRCQTAAEPAAGPAARSSLQPAPPQRAQEVSTSLMFGFLGLTNALALLPLLVFLGVETPELKGFDGPVFAWLSLKALADNVLSDYLWARAVLLTTPTIATVGLSLTIPVAFALDALIHGSLPAPLAGAGAALVLAGFATVTCSR